MLTPKSRITFLGFPKGQKKSSQGIFARSKPSTEFTIPLSALSKKFDSKNIRKNG